MIYGSGRSSMKVPAFPPEQASPKETNNSFSMKQIITCVLLLMVSASTFAQSLERAQHDYRRRYVELSTLQLPDSLARLRVSHECRTALEFLYAYMPWPDVVDYSVDYHRQQVECALKARTELPWGAAVYLG